ncbi:tyrosine-type recombinase/integrase [Bradyrhizobium iriomotense]|uniref:Site-specific integrase n=1 Tax=Bradyrhizobium iriomotense TaxID=441950 RepID=A0ABQ6AZN0_9BRAD|nr:site-specific integrase [Bradyrhizobium iriomotense]GLR86539.1 site-specific integrase [Bradyrhizobium iriomotense]
MSVRKRKWISPGGLEKEAWVVDYVDLRGKRRNKQFIRKKAADEFDTTVKGEMRAGTHTAETASITVNEAGDRWIANCENASLERTTVDAYRSHLELHIKPFLGVRKLTQLTVPMITDWERKLRDGTADQKPRSTAMIKRVRNDLGALLSNAMDEGLVARNVVAEMRSKRRRNGAQSERRAKRKLQVGVDIPTPEEIKAMVGAMEEYWRPILLTAIFTGLRASELRGLRWANVDLSRRELHVRERADEYKQMGRPKSEAGERTVPLPPLVVAELRRWKLKCPKTDLGLAFPSPVEGVGIVGLTYMVKRGLWPTQIAAGITKVGKNSNGKVATVAKYSGLHSLRHFFASWCINRKVDGGLELPVKMVQERLGHSTVAMTLDIYGHLFPRADDTEELAAAERALLG